MANLSPVHDGKVAKVAEELLARTGCTNVKTFAGDFGAKEDLIVTFWESVPGLQRSCALLAYMRMALINLVDAAKKSRDQETHSLTRPWITQSTQGPTNLSHGMWEGGVDSGCTRFKKVHTRSWEACGENRR